MDIGAAFVTNAEATKLMQPCIRSLDNPAKDAQSASVLRVALGKDGFDAAPSQGFGVRCGMIGAITLNALRTLARKPVVEVAGLHTRASGRRVEVDLERFLPHTDLEVAVILDDESLDRRGGGGGTDPRVLCQAMVARDHEGVKSYFRALERYARVRQAR